MADGNIKEATPASTDRTAVHTLLLSGDKVLDLIVADPDFWGREHTREVADQLVRLANSSLGLAISRGEDETDMPGMYAEALEGVSVLLQLAVGVSEAATRGVSNG